MDLAPLTLFLTENPRFREALEKIEKGRTLCVDGGSGQLFFAAALQRTGRPWVWIARSAESAKRWQSDLRVFGIEATYLPPVEILPYAGVSPEEELRNQRQQALSKILDKNFPLVTTAKALSLLVPSAESWAAARLRITPGDRLPPQLLIQQLVKLGFQPAAAVTEKGEFSRRGGVLDVFPPQLDSPVRIDWFDDEIESIKLFEIQSQRSLEKLDSLEVWPSRELIFPEEGWQNIAGSIEKASAAQGKRLRKQVLHQAAGNLESLTKAAVERFKTFQSFEGCEYYLPFFQELKSVFSYLPSETVLLWEDQAFILEQLISWQKEQLSLYEKRTKAGEAIELPRMLHLEPADVRRSADTFGQISFSGRTLDSFPLGSQPAPSFGNQFDQLADSASAWSKAGEKVLIASTQPHRAYAILDERHCHASYGSVLPEPGWKVGGVWIVRESLSSGFRWPELGLTVLTDSELFGWTKKNFNKREARRPSFAGNAFSSVTELKENDFVVHLKHGIGVYGGLKKLAIGEEEREYLLVTYHGDDKLYVPVDQIGLLHRYRGGVDSRPKVHKMGGVEWENLKRRVKKSVEIVAADLLKLYAERASQPGYSFPPDTIWQTEMEAAFPYQETVDQLRAIAETKQDMERERPTDRLICGDVGFGKTEVALRAVFKAIMAGKQVALLAPTTLLAQQHFQVFRDRFKPYPIECALLSRFRTPKETKEAISGLATGKIEFVVGTHRLLQKDVSFKDLGLLVIDEEHRFGVAHKERLKQLRHSVDVITMSATPIPRTLYLALSGARDMSLITTPPLNRHPIKTVVGPYDAEAIKTAILHELERDGQIFFLHNRVESIHAMAEEVGKLVPQARIAVAHGQMHESDLEDIMFAFLNREIDVLVTTTIIESGLDIPNANTIV
ncbi:MAG TPA: transcription-repair coupling factor, partial [Cyanobacteria bacterium UBA8530]|nr:transcription-repair coupling factor [Cyanobacteria bacterium UBA8530]